MKSSQSIYLLNKALCSPLEAFFTLLIFILSKELQASIFQLTIYACIKPTVSLIAFHAIQLVQEKPHRRRLFLVIAPLAGALPCLMFPFVNNVWFFIAAYVLFMTALRASYPVWMEHLKCSMEFNRIASVAAKGSAVNYTLVTIVPLLFAGMIDHYPNMWRFIFIGLASLQILFALIVFWLPQAFENQKCMQGETRQPLLDKQPIRISFLQCWAEGWHLLKKNPQFVKYQIVFFIGGAGVVAVQPILPSYFHEQLHLTYTQLAFAFSVCKGIGFVSLSPIWVSLAKKHSLFLLNPILNTLSSAFILCLVLSTQSTAWLFLGYLLYGSMQAGCELSWNLSGPSFASDKESTLYSGINLVFVGIRGCIFPFAGQLLLTCADAFTAFSAAGVGCIFSIFYAISVYFDSFQRDRNSMPARGQ